MELGLGVSMANLILSSGDIPPVGEANVLLLDDSENGLLIDGQNYLLIS